jgi:hypothetical protein
MGLGLYAGGDAVLTVLDRVTAWAANMVDRSRNAASEFDFWGEYPAKTHEWYTVPENLYRAYQVSGNAAFRESRTSGVTSSSGTASRILPSQPACHPFTRIAMSTR